MQSLTNYLWLNRHKRIANALNQMIDQLLEKTPAFRYMQENAPIGAELITLEVELREFVSLFFGYYIMDASGTYRANIASTLKAAIPKISEHFYALADKATPITQEDLNALFAINHNRSSPLNLIKNVIYNASLYTHGRFAAVVIGCTLFSIASCLLPNILGVTTLMHVVSLSIGALLASLGSFLLIQHYAWRHRYYTIIKKQRPIPKPLSPITSMETMCNDIKRAKNALTESLKTLSHLPHVPTDAIKIHLSAIENTLSALTQNLENTAVNSDRNTIANNLTLQNGLTWERFQYRQHVIKFKELLIKYTTVQSKKEHENLHAKIVTTGKQLGISEDTRETLLKKLTFTNTEELMNNLFGDNADALETRITSVAQELNISRVAAENFMQLLSLHNPNTFDLISRLSPSNAVDLDYLKILPALLAANLRLLQQLLHKKRSQHTVLYPMLHYLPKQITHWCIKKTSNSLAIFSDQIDDVFNQLQAIPAYQDIINMPTEKTNNIREILSHTQSILRKIVLEIINNDQDAIHTIDALLTDKRLHAIIEGLEALAPQLARENAKQELEKREAAIKEIEKKIEDFISFPSKELEKELAEANIDLCYAKSALHAANNLPEHHNLTFNEVLALLDLNHPDNPMNSWTEY